MNKIGLTGVLLGSLILGGCGTKSPVSEKSAVVRWYEDIDERIGQTIAEIDMGPLRVVKPTGLSNNQVWEGIGKDQEFVGYFGQVSGSAMLGPDWSKDKETFNRLSARMSFLTEERSRFYRQHKDEIDRALPYEKNRFRNE